MKHLGGGNFTEPEKGEGDICLILNEVRGESGGYWPVMSFPSEEEAMRLSEQLREAVETNRKIRLEKQKVM